MRHRLPPLAALLAFRAAATHHRLADAAASLGVSESAVSHQLRHLETYLQTQLFDRQGGRLALTPTGARYLERIDPALLELQAATEAVLPAPDRASVRLTLPPSLAVTWLIPQLGEFEEAHPSVALELVATTRLIDLRRDQIDLAVRYGKGAWPGIEAQFLFDDLATVVAAPSLVPLDGTRPVQAVLAAHRRVVNRSVPDEWAEWSKAHGFEVPDATRGTLVLDTIEQVLQAAESGAGLAIGREPYLAERMAAGTLVAPFGRGTPTTAAYYLCRPGDVEPTVAARRVARWLGEVAQHWRRTSPKP